MSSILRALKKLDEETRSQEGLAGIPKIEVDHMVTRHPQSTFRRVIFIAVPVLVLVVAVWVMFNSRPETSPVKPKVPSNPPQTKPTPEPAKPSKPSHTKPAAAAAQQKKSAEETPQPPPPAAPKDEPVRATPEKPVQPPARTPAQTPAQASVQTRPTVVRDANGRRIMMPSRPRLNDGRSRPAPFPVPQRSPQSQQATQSPQTPQSSGAAQNPPQNPPKVRPQFNLEGILWSQNVKRRVALINDKYLKEGDTIKGITILRIERKSVTLKSGEDTWSIRLKQ